MRLPGLAHVPHIDRPVPPSGIYLAPVCTPTGLVRIHKSEVAQYKTILRTDIHHGGVFSPIHRRPTPRPGECTRLSQRMT